MTGAVLADANLLLLLIVGSASRRVHKNLSHYTEDDFDLLVQAISIFSDVVLVPHLLAEVSSLSRQGIKNPARRAIQQKLRELVETTPEVPVPSVDGVRRDEFPDLGLTDAVMLHLGALGERGKSLVTFHRWRGAQS